MSLSNYPTGFNSDVLIRELLIGTGGPRKNLYVDNNATLLANEKGASDSNNNGTFLQPFATLSYAISQANAGDTIWIRPGHVETTAAAAGLVLNVAGIIVVFMGNGANKATVKFATAVGASMDITAANVTLIGPRFLAALDALTAAINISGANCKILNAEWYDDTAINTTYGIKATAAATGLIIDGYRFVDGDGAGTQKQSHIQFPATNNAVLRNIDIRGDFKIGNIQNITNPALNLRLENLNLENTNTDPQPALYLNANATGTCKNVKLHVASGTTYASSYAKMAWDNTSEGFSGTSSPAGDALGTAPSSGIEGKIDTLTTDMNVPTADVATNTLIRDAVGNKTDASVTASAATKSIMAYAKGSLDLQLVPTADVATNTTARDVIGNKTDASVVTSAATKSITGYVKGLVDLQAVPTADVATNVQLRDAVGNKADASVVTSAATKSIMGYVKGLVDVAAVPGADVVTNVQERDVVGNKTDASVYVPGTTKSLAAYIKGVADLQERVAKKAAATMVNAQVMFTVAGGPIEIIALVSVCETLNDATASTLQYNVTPTTGSATTISGASASLANAAAGASVALAGTALATAALLSAGGPNLMANPGTIFCPIGTINMIIAVGSTTGTWAHYLRYKPLAAGVTVT